VKKEELPEPARPWKKKYVGKKVLPRKSKRGQRGRYQSEKGVETQFRRKRATTGESESLKVRGEKLTLPVP